MIGMQKTGSMKMDNTRLSIRFMIILLATIVEPLCSLNEFESTSLSTESSHTTKNINTMSCSPPMKERNVSY